MRLCEISYYYLTSVQYKVVRHVFNVKNGTNAMPKNKGGREAKKPKKVQASKPVVL